MIFADLHFFLPLFISWFLASTLWWIILISLSTQKNPKMKWLLLPFTFWFIWPLGIKWLALALVKFLRSQWQAWNEDDGLM